MNQRSVRVLLEDMLDCIAAIQEYTRDVTFDEFQARRMVQDAVIRRIEILGEAARALPDEWKSQHPQVPWRVIADMRNRLIHGYFTVNLDLTWNTVQNDLPELERQLRNLLDQEP